MFVVADESMWADGAALDVTCEVSDGGVAATDVLELHVPGFIGQEGGFGGGREALIDFWVLALEGEAKEVAKTLGEGCVVDEESFILGMDEAFLIRLPCECGNDAVDVRMVLELASPGVQDAGEAGEAASGLGGDDIAQGLGALLEDGSVEFFGMGEAGLA